MRDDLMSNTHHFASLRNQFLISMPSLEQSIFNHTVTYICDHNSQGAMGIIINTPMGITLGQVFEQLDIDSHYSSHKTHVLAGGPVNAQQGLVLHRNQGKWDSTLEVTPEICLTSSRDIIEAMAIDSAPVGAQLVLGYAGWGAGQLEQELKENFWLTMSAESSIIFDTPTEHRWSEAAKCLGIQLELVCSQIGHA